MTNAKTVTKKLLSCLLCLCLVLPLFSSAFVPLAAELKAALTVESSAASTTDLSTIQYTSGGYHYYYYPSGATYVSQIGIKTKGGWSTTNLFNQFKNEGYYYPTDIDLNKGTGSTKDTIKFGFKMTADPTQAFTKVAVSSSYSNCTIGSSTSWPAYYRFATSGTSYNVTWEQSNTTDLNQGAGGSWLHFCNTHDTRVGKPLTFIYIVEGGSSTQYARYLNNSGYADLNQDAGGDYVYLVQEDGTQTNRECYDKHAYVNTTEVTDVSDAIQQLQDTYNTYNDYLVSGRYTTATYNALNTALNNAADVINDFSDCYSSTYTAAKISPYTQAIIDAANALETTVYFDAATNGGTTSVTSATILIGTDTSASYNFITTGYSATKGDWTFLGWNTNQNATSGSSSFAVGYNTTLYAIFSKTATVQFNYLTASGSPTSIPTNLTFYNNDTSKTVTAPAGVESVTVKNEGTFTMLGYRDDTEAAAKEIDRSATVTITSDAANATAYSYYGVYERNDLSLSYSDSYGATGMPAAQTAHQYRSASGARTSHTFTVAEDSPAIDGYNFLGWAASPNGAAAYQAGDTIAIEYDTILYAAWKTASYEITFDTNGGSAMETKEYTTESNESLASVPTKTGYTFTHWIAENAEGTWVDGERYVKGTPLKGMRGDVTLVAQWQANANTPYSVVHMTQTVDGTGYEQYLVENLTGTTDTTVDTADFYDEISGFYASGSQVNGSDATVATIAPDGSLVITLYYNRVSCTVTATAGNGIASVTGAGTYLYGAEITLTAAVKDGYAFAGWTGTNTGDSTELTVTVTGDVDVTASADMVTYRVSYNATGGKLTGSYTTSYVITDTITLPIAVRDGYDFAGWTLEQDGTGTNNWNADALGADAATVGPDLYGNVILHAQWTAKEYTITFETDGGNAIAALTYTIESTDRLPTPQKHGYIPTGWVATAAEGNWVLNKNYNCGSTVNAMYGNVTLTATYSQIPYTLSYDAAGGSVTPSYIIYTIDGTVTSPTGAQSVLATPTRPGYTFNGWLCTESWADQNDELNACDWVVDIVYDAGLSLAGIAGNAKFTAQWTANKYDLTAVPGYATYEGATGTDVLTAGVDYTATLSVADGYKLGENIQVDINGKTAAAGTDYTFTSDNGFVTATLVIKGSSIIGDVVVTPNTSLIDYTLTYVGVNQGHGFPATYNIESEEITIGAPSRNGYRFTGWTGDGITGSAMSITIPTGSMGNKTFTANWVKEYTISFVVPGGTYIAPIKYIAGEDVIVPAAVKDAAKFLYWTATGAWTDEVLNPGTFSGRTGDATLTAVFAAATSYNIEEYFMNTDGTYTTANTQVISENVYVGDSVSTTFGSYEGFTPDEASSNLSGTVLADGALALRLYYSRNKYAVNVTADENIASVEGAGSYYYGEAVTLKATAKAGYEVVGWTGDHEGDGDMIGFTVGTSDVNVTVTSKYLEFTVEFVVEGGEAPATIVYNPTETVTLPAIEKAGYDMFWYVPVTTGSWTAGNMTPGDYTEMNGDVILTAVWVERNDTPYIIEEYFQNIEDDNYAEAVVKNMTGTTNAVVALPEEYEGFKTPLGSELVISGDGKTVVKYYYTRNSYTVTYNINDFKVVETYKFGQSIYEPESPAVGGYRFNGWDKEIADTMPAENLVYTADMTLLTYSITFSGAMGSAIPTIQYNVTQSVELPQINEPGYYVVWTLEDRSGSWLPGEYMAGSYGSGHFGNITLKAINVANTNTPYIIHTVLENLDGTYAEPTSVETYGTTGEVVAAPQDIEGYVTPAASKVLIKGNGTTEVTYTYDRAIYNITYDVLGDTTVKNYKYGADVTAPADPEVNGYEFLGWSDEIVSIMPAQNLVYTANFDAITYTVTFDVDGGSAVENVTYIVSDTVTLPESEKYGYHFTGWQVQTSNGNWIAGQLIDAAFTGKYGDISVKAVWSEVKADYTVKIYYMGTDGTYGEAEEIVNTGLVGETATYEMPEVTGFTADTANSTLSVEILEDNSAVIKAYYIRNKYAVTTAVAGNGAVAITESKDYYYGETVEIEVTVKDHYVVDSWTGVTASGSTASFEMPAAEVVISATVVPVVYTYSFDGDVVEYTIESQITVPTASKPGYVFDGWTLATADGNWTPAEVVAGNVLNEKYGNVTIISNWIEKIYSIAYDANEGTMPESYFTPAGEYTVTSIIVLPIPTRTGYRFAGWNVTKANADECNWEDSFIRNTDNIGTGRYGNVTLVASWTALDVEVYVEHYLQYTWSDDYMLLDKYTDYHTAGTEIDIEEDVAKTHEGAYHFVKALVNDEEAETVTVNADGTTAIKLYYDLDEHNVTVNYVTPDGVEAPAKYVGTFRYGQNYNVKSPSVVGYEPSSVTVAGRMDTEDVEATITYALANYDITVNYYYADKSIAADSVTVTKGYGEVYAIESPVIDGYTPSFAVVEGTVAGEDVEVDVVYGINTHTLTIEYVYADGTKAADDYTAEVEFGYEFNVKSAAVVGHTAQQAYVSGVMGDADAVYTVKYNVNYYTVIFEDYDGTEISVQSVAYGTAATAPADPAREADSDFEYEFKGWSCEFDEITEDTVVVAEYTARNITTGEVEGDDGFESSGNPIIDFFRRLIRFLKILFMIV